MPKLKVYCERCGDFTYHDFRRVPFCDICRGKGHPALVMLVMLVPIAAFVYAVFRIWRGGGW